MTATLSALQDINLLPSIVAETKLLRHFAGEADAFIFERENYLENDKYFLAQAQSRQIAGFGRASTRRKALVKAVAEFYERRLMQDVFSNELSYIPKALQTSNGFAVHFSQSQATQASILEVTERHLLQYSFLKDGWNGFELIKQNKIGQESLTFVASRYSINGLRAGMVLATSERFPGISFGYFADEKDKIESSLRWSHGIFEAFDKIEPFLKLAQTSKVLTLMPIEQGILKWMMTQHEKMDFMKGGLVKALPNSSIKTKTFDLSERWDLDFPLFGAYSFSDDILPLLVVDRLKEGDSALVLDILSRFHLPSQIPERNPVL